MPMPAGQAQCAESMYEGFVQCQQQQLQPQAVSKGDVVGDTTTTQLQWRATKGRGSTTVQQTVL